MKDACHKVDNGQPIHPGRTEGNLGGLGFNWDRGGGEVQGILSLILDTR
jgi:hypothetical protein